MRKHLSYYFWRVAVGVTIGLIMLFFSHPEAFALTWDLDYQSEKVNIWANQYTYTSSLDDGGSKWIPFTNTFTNSSGFNFAVIQITSITYGNPQSITLTDMQLRFSMPSQQGASSLCELQGSAIVCPMIKNYTYRGINIFWSTNAALYDAAFSIKLANSVQYYNYHSDSADSPQGQTASNTQEIKDNTKETNDLIKSDDIGDDSGHSSTFASWQNSSAQNGTITNLITLPITLYTSILNNINGTCSSFSLGSLYGSSLTMTCIQPSQYLGTTLWGVIDMLFSGFFIFIISKKMIKVFNNMSMLKEGDILD